MRGTISRMESVPTHTESYTARERPEPATTESFTCVTPAAVPARQRTTSGTPHGWPGEATASVEALLRHASDPRADLLAEAEAEVAVADAASYTAGDDERGQGWRPPDLTDVQTLRRVLARHGLRPNKSFGQHLLTDRAALETIVATAELQSDDQLLGGGCGHWRADGGACEAGTSRGGCGA